MHDERTQTQSGATAPPRLLDLMRDAIRRRHYSHRTEETYAHWMKRFIIYSGKRHPKELGAAEVTAFLNHLAQERKVAASTQNQALAALLFLYKEVIAQPLPWLDQVDHAKRPVRQPTVLTRAEARALLDCLHGTRCLMASLLYGAGLRLRECLTLRVKDVDFGYRQIVVRDARELPDPRGEIRGARGRYHQACQLPHAAPLVCDSPAGKRLRHPHRAGIARPRDMSTTMIYTHVLNKGGRGVRGPLDGP